MFFIVHPSDLGKSTHIPIFENVRQTEGKDEKIPIMGSTCISGNPLQEFRGWLRSKPKLQDQYSRLPGPHTWVCPYFGTAAVTTR